MLVGCFYNHGCSLVFNFNFSTSPPLYFKWTPVFCRALWFYKRLSFNLLKCKYPDNFIMCFYDTHWSLKTESFKYSITFTTNPENKILTL
ncbi:hypothetical protein AB205_0147560 [Aquarana catesbeiana]|uniref:Uncharacterized protein n=1 Tax=Aquarana catesbeiana TaxID=8400 RepID=A0A2G9S4L1_AQUCT|nr:hypothetical protein AB205_0147560 [Aquarana catesbeiana]